MDANVTGRFIAEMRRQKGYTQKELAEKLMVTDKAVSRWETGKGLPDTSLLKPLGDILGVSVGELLSGRKFGDAEVREHSDMVILDALRYSRRMLAGAANLFFFLAGAALMISPLFLASQRYLWIPGAALVSLTVLRFCAERKGPLSRKAHYLAAMVLQGTALVLEILPVGAVMVFATGPDDRVTKTFSYFSLLPLGYANFAPLAAGVLTIVTLLLGVISLFRFDKAARYRKAAFLCDILALFFSVAPLLLFGAVGMTAASYTVCGAILFSICLQAVANRQD